MPDVTPLDSFRVEFMEKNTQHAAHCATQRNGGPGPQWCCTCKVAMWHFKPIFSAHEVFSEIIGPDEQLSTSKHDNHVKAGNYCKTCEAIIIPHPSDMKKPSRNTFREEMRLRARKLLEEKSL